MHQRSNLKKLRMLPTSEIEMGTRTKDTELIYGHLQTSTTVKEGSMERVISLLGLVVMMGLA